jgi:hypothetical protein
MMFRGRVCSSTHCGTLAIFATTRCCAAQNQADLTQVNIFGGINVLLALGLWAKLENVFASYNQTHILAERL